MKKTGLFVLLTFMTVLGSGTASFAVCSATEITAGNGVWGIEASGSAPLGGLANLLMQVTFTSTGTFSGTEWQMLYQSGSWTFTSAAISGTWAMVSPATDCQGTINVTNPSTRAFNFILNSAGKSALIEEADSSQYQASGFMVPEGTVTCANTLFTDKQFSLYWNGNAPAWGGAISAAGEVKFDATGTTLNSLPTVTFDLGAPGVFVLPGTGTSSLSSGCTGTASLTIPKLQQTFNVDTVVVDSGKEVLWIGTNLGMNFAGYLLQ